MRTEVANAVLFRAIALIGTPYHFGGNTPLGGFDCSGLVAYVFRDAARVVLPRTSREMSELDVPTINREDLQAGDLVFFRARREISHVGIYVGKQRFVDAPNSGGTVRLDEIDGPWWRQHFAYGKRVL
ncbi:MAG: C40 family peptidase [Rhodanobacteraceae bacterium]